MPNIDFNARFHCHDCGEDFPVANHIAGRPCCPVCNSTDLSVRCFDEDWDDD